MNIYRVAKLKWSELGGKWTVVTPFAAYGIQRLSPPSRVFYTAAADRPGGNAYWLGSPTDLATAMGLAQSHHEKRMAEGLELVTPMVRLEKGRDGHGLTFELVLLDGLQGTDHESSVQIESSSDMAELAGSLGFVQILDEDISGVGGGAAVYDYLESHIGACFEDPGFFGKAE